METLLDKHISKGQLREVAGLSKGIITKMGKNKSVKVEVFTKICDVLDCDVIDVLSISPDSGGNGPVEGN